MSDAERISEAALDRQVPHPSPESVVASALAKHRTDCVPHNAPTASQSERRQAHRIIAALRASGWRILR